MSASKSIVSADVLERAIVFAVNAHMGQRRKGDGRPYILHPMSVMQRIQSIKKSNNIYMLGAAAILHDTVEDCGVDIDVIAKEFGFHVAALVDELTLDKNQYEQIGKKEYLAQELCHMTSYALAIKLCDRLDNVCDMKEMKPSFQNRYVEETTYILDVLEASKRSLTKTHKALIKMIRKELKKYV